MVRGFTSHYRSIEVVGEIGGAFVPPLFSLPRQAGLGAVGHGLVRFGMAGRARRGWAGLARVRRAWAG